MSSFLLKHQLKLFYSSVFLVSGIFFTFYTIPNYDAGIGANFLKNSLSNWGMFMFDSDYLNEYWFFRKPYFFVYTLIFKYFLPFSYDALAGSLYLLILLNTYLSYRIFLFFLEKSMSQHAAFFYFFLLYTISWFSPLRADAYLVTIANMTLLLHLKYAQTQQLKFIYWSLFLVGAIGITLHYNGGFLCLYLLGSLGVLKLDKQKVLRIFFVALVSGILGSYILFYPGIPEFITHMQNMANDGERFNLVWKFFKIILNGVIRNPYYLIIIVAFGGLLSTGRKNYTHLFKIDSEFKKIIYLYLGAYTVFFMILPGAHWGIYSIHLLLPWILCFMMLLENHWRLKKPDGKVILFMSVLLLLALAYAYSKMNLYRLVLIPLCFLPIIIFRKINLRLVYCEVLLALSFCFYNFYVNHTWYSQVSSIIRNSGHTEWVSNAIFEFAGEYIDIRPENLKRTQQIKNLENFSVLINSENLKERYRNKGERYQVLQFKHPLIPSEYQKWYLLQR